MSLVLVAWVGSVFYSTLGIFLSTFGIKNLEQLDESDVLLMG